MILRKWIDDSRVDCVTSLYMVFGFSWLRLYNFSCMQV